MSINFNDARLRGSDKSDRDDRRNGRDDRWNDRGGDRRNDRDDRWNNNRNQNNNNRNNNHNHNQNNNNHKNGKNNNKENNKHKHDFAKVFAVRSESILRFKYKYIQRTVIDFLPEVIEEISHAKSKKKNVPHYINNAVYDFVFAETIDKAIDKHDLNKKDMKALSGILVPFVKDAISGDPFRNIVGNNKELETYYDRYTAETMLNIYSDIIVSANKKRYKKIKKSIDGLDKEEAKIIAILSAGNVYIGVRGILGYISKQLYKNEDNFNIQITQKSIDKLFKSCFGEGSSDDILITMMLDIYRDNNNIERIELLNDSINDIILTRLDKCNGRTLRNILRRYAEIKQNNRIQNRGGGRDDRFYTLLKEMDKDSAIVKAVKDLSRTSIVMRKMFNI